MSQTYRKAALHSFLRHDIIDGVYRDCKHAVGLHARGPRKRITRWFQGAHPSLLMDPSRLFPKPMCWYSLGAGASAGFPCGILRLVPAVAITYIPDTAQFAVGSGITSLPLLQKTSDRDTEPSSGLSCHVDHSGKVATTVIFEVLEVYGDENTRYVTSSLGFFTGVCKSILSLVEL